MSAASEDLARLVDAAHADDTDVWPDPLPLAEQGAAEPYPIDALPPTLAEAVTEVQAFVQAPMALVAGCALAALSTAAQAYVDVERAPHLQGPTGLFLLMIADSGERKTSCDNFFTKGIREWESAQPEKYRPVVEDHRADVDAWETERSALLDSIRMARKKRSDTAPLRAELREHEAERPKSPRVPRLVYTDATPEALAQRLAEQWPAGAILSSEAGVVFGSHGMGRESNMRNFGLLNTLWDGGTLSVDRRTGGSFTVRGARLTVGLAVQEPTLREFFERSQGLARGIGFLARFLIAWPESTQGKRFFRDGPTHWLALERFQARIRQILAAKAPIGDDGTLMPRCSSWTRTPLRRGGGSTTRLRCSSGSSASCTRCETSRRRRPTTWPGWQP